MFMNILIHALATDTCFQSLLVPNRILFIDLVIVSSESISFIILLGNMVNGLILFYLSN